MVMDIRQLWSGDEADDKASEAQNPQPKMPLPKAPVSKSSSTGAAADQVIVPVEDPMDESMNDLADPEIAAAEMAAGVGSTFDDLEPTIDLADLIQQVATGDAETRARAAAELRALVPGSEGIELLFYLAARLEDPRRLPAVQALGHHRQWLSSRTRVEAILRLARDERDPEVAAALVWTLRQREELREFLLHTMHPVSREAALGVPLSESTIEGIVHALLVGRAPDVDAILANRALTHLTIVRARDARWELLVGEGGLEKLLEWSEGGGNTFSAGTMDVVTRANLVSIMAKVKKGRVWIRSEGKKELLEYKAK